MHGLPLQRLRIFDEKLMSKAIRVLNIEDSERDAMFVNRHLTNAGYELVSDRVDTPEAVRKTLANNTWDIILCDYSMPKLNALEALAILQETGLDIPLIIISGMLGDEIAVEAMLTGANDYLPKDNLSRLVPAIQRALTEAENRRIQRLAEKERRIIFDIIQGTITTPNLDDFLTLVHRSIRKILYAENCFITLYDPIADRLSFEFWADEHDPKPDPHPIDHGFGSYVLRTGKPLLVTEQTREKMRKSGDAEMIGTSAASWLGVPLRTPIRTIGVLAIQHYNDKDAYSKRDVEFLASVGDQIAFAIERKRAEEALRESEGRYRMLFDYAPDGILITNADGDYLEANSSICSMLGYGNDQLAGMNLSDIVSETEIRHLESAFENGGSRSQYEREWDVRRKDGTLFPADVMATRMPDNNMLTMIRDVSDRRSAETERAELTNQIESQRELLKNIVANVPGIVWESCGSPSQGDATGSFVSEYVTTMLGYTVDEWISVPNFWLSIVHPDHQERVARDAAAAYMDGDSCVLEFPWITKSGQVIWVESHSAIIFGQNGTPIGLRGVTIDITERKHAAEALQESEERYRDLVENAIDMIYTHDLDGNFSSVNRAGPIITGYSRDEFLGLNMRDMIAPEFVAKAKEMTAAKLEGKNVPAYDIEIIAQDGRRIAVEVNTRLIYDNRVPVQIQGIARDITERKHLEEKFRQSHKMEAIGLLAGGIAHDFNNLLTAISGYSELTLRKMNSDDPLRHNISEIKDAGDRAGALTSQLLAFSRKQVLNPRVHNLNTVISDIEKMLRRIIRESIEFRTILDPGLHNIKADPGQIEQVIMNLSINARDAMPHGGSLVLQTQNINISETEAFDRLNIGPGRFVKMSVKDNGEGMDEETLGRMFEPFFTTKDSGKGTGLGLSTVYGIIKQSGGDIDVFSEVGKGTTFDIYLPSIDDPAQSQKWRGSNGNAQTQNGNETILLVEDEEIVRNLVREILVSGGYKVLEAASGPAALSIYKAHPNKIDLLITDVIMPKMSGLELGDQLVSLSPAIKILFMSGYTDDSIDDSRLLEPNRAFIEKPFTPDELARKIRNTLKA